MAEPLSNKLQVLKWCAKLAHSRRRQHLCRPSVLIDSERSEIILGPALTRHAWGPPRAVLAPRLGRDANIDMKKQNERFPGPHPKHGGEMRGGMHYSPVPHSGNNATHPATGRLTITPLLCLPCKPREVPVECCSPSRKAEDQYGVHWCAQPGMTTGLVELTPTQAGWCVCSCLNHKDPTSSRTRPEQSRSSGISGHRKWVIRM